MNLLEINVDENSSSKRQSNLVKGNFGSEVSQSDGHALSHITRQVVQLLVQLLYRSLHYPTVFLNLLDLTRPRGRGAHYRTVFLNKLDLRSH